jgi:hypothetical protein
MDLMVEILRLIILFSSKMRTNYRDVLEEQDSENNFFPEFKQGLKVGN